jgi:hypothetical protein
LITISPVSETFIFSHPGKRGGIAASAELTLRSLDAADELSVALQNINPGLGPDGLAELRSKAPAKRTVSNDQRIIASVAHRDGRLDELDEVLWSPVQDCRAVSRCSSLSAAIEG